MEKANKYYSPWDGTFSGKLMVLDRMETVVPTKLNYNGLVEIKDEKGFLHRVHKRDLWELRLQLVGGNVINIPDNLVREIVALNNKPFRVKIDSQIISLSKSFNDEVPELTKTVNGSNKPRPRILLSTSDDSDPNPSNNLFVRIKSLMDRI